MCAGMLQASYMRKWMSDRLKRRKKPGEGSSQDGSSKEKGSTTAPEPLQPKYYESGNEGAAPVEARAETREVESQRPFESEPMAEPETGHGSAAEPAGASAARPRTARRRRSRGGRGGSRARTAAVAPAAGVEASAVEAESAEPVSAGQSPAEAAPVEGAPIQVASAPARASKGTVVLAIGLPGSGKSSWFKRHNIHPLSSDLLRELLFDDAQEQRFQDLVFSNLRSMLKARLIARRPMNYVDATNLTPHDRHSWIKLAKDYGYDVQGVFFDVPLEVCLERHERRGRVVPEDVMRKMAGKLKPPTFEEGFSKITVVRVKQKEAAAG